MTNPFDLSFLPRLIRPLVRRFTGAHVLGSWYAQWQAHTQQTVDAFLDFVIDKSGFEIAVEGPDSLPSGPLLIVANHPLGAIEGMILARYLRRHRPDVRVLTNQILKQLPEFEELFIGVDILSASPDNRRSILEAKRHLVQGNALMVFPAGRVGEWDADQQRVVDPEWKTSAARWAKAAKATCLPVGVSGRNPLWFYQAGRISKRLRTALLGQALLHPTTPITMRIGQPIAFDDLPQQSPEAITDYLRLTCELLATDKPQPSAALAEIVETPQAPDVSHLAPYLVVEKGNLGVFCAPHSALGPMADHLAEMREITFSLAGEGSGKARDIDAFDGHYWHLLAWDFERQQLVGGYRAAAVSDVIQNQGAEGLYSHSLFNYRSEHLSKLHGCIEVGRSFVTPAYQRNPRALDLLWEGLGRFLASRPDCHSFIGCVSISNDYPDSVKSVLHTVLLKSYGATSDWQTAVTPSAPFRLKMPHWTAKLGETLSSVAEVNKIFGSAALEFRVPVLIRRYLALNGRFVDFSVNRNFRDSLDGLIFVDLREAPSRYLKRYLGADEYSAFLNRWKATANAA